jgi:membrane peptidoglycan carboxypeptidase
MGISTFNDPDRYGLSMALGSNEVRLLDLTGAYNTLRNHGHHTPPVAILDITNSRGEVLYQWEPRQGPQVFNRDGEQVAYLITDILSDNQARWYMFGRGNVMELPDGRPAAVKTGTSNDWRDSWAIGYTPDVTVGVWVGNNDNAPMQEIAGANGAGEIWRAVMTAYHADIPPHSFERPAQVVEREVCAHTGDAATEACPDTIREVFVAGSTPQEATVRFETYRVANDGSCMATVFTPLNESREVTYAVYPPAFRDWAIRNGIPQPPTEPCPMPEVDPGTTARLDTTGTVQQGEQVFIRGVANGSYILDVGAGRDPTAWELINRSGTTATPVGDVATSTLGIWATADAPPGDYLLRLRVTAADGREIMTTRTVQVQE